MPSNAWTYHLTHCPITYSSWTHAQRLSVHKFALWTAVKLSRKFPFFTPGDLYNSGYCGYLKAISKLTYTIDSPGLGYTKTAIKGAMIAEIWTIYGRPTYSTHGYVGKGDLKAHAEIACTEEF